MNGVNLRPHGCFAFRGQHGPLLFELADHIDANLILSLGLLQKEALVLGLNLDTNGCLQYVGLVVVKEKARVGLLECTHGLVKDDKIRVLGKHLGELRRERLKLVEECLEEDAAARHCDY
jgi:hypothetical protein